MILCRVYTPTDGKQCRTLVYLKVNSVVVFSSDEDQCGHLPSVLDLMCADNASGFTISAKIATITMEPASSYTTTKTKIVAGAAYGIPILLWNGVFLVMNRTSPHTSVLAQLERLHFATLQTFCRRGPDSPFDELKVARNEWHDAYASGTGCRAVMINRLKRLHLARFDERSAAKGGTRAVSSRNSANNRFLFLAVLRHDSAATLRLATADGEAKEFETFPLNGKTYAHGVLSAGLLGNRATVEVVIAVSGTHSHTIDAPVLCEPIALGNDGSIIFYTDELSAVSNWLSSVDHSSENRNDVSQTKSTISNETSCYVLDVTSLPKLGAVVVPLSLATRSSGLRLINLEDVTGPVLQDVSSKTTEVQAPGLTASRYWHAPPNENMWPVEMTFEYIKVDPCNVNSTKRLDRGEDVKVSTKTVTITKDNVDNGKEIPLSSTSTLRVSRNVSGLRENDQGIEMMKYYSCAMLRTAVDSSPFLSVMAATGASKSLLQKCIAVFHKLNEFDASRVYRPDDVSLQNNLPQYLQGLCNLLAEGLQDRCASPRPEDLAYISVHCWRNCWTYGSGARIAMLRNIAYYLMQSGHVHPFLSYISSNLEAHSIYACLQRLATSHYGTLQRQCRDGGTHIPGTEVLKMSPREWKMCLRDGKGCRDAMAAAAAEFVDRRVLLGLRLQASKPTGMLDW
jgi:hypothetical protein